MRAMSAAILFLALTFESQAAQAPAEASSPMKDFMVKTVQSNADPILYISRGAPENDAQWAALLKNATALKAAARQLLTPAMARDQDQWVKDTQALIDASDVAIARVRKKDAPALEELNEQLYNACEGCHEHYRAKP